MNNKLSIFVVFGNMNLNFGSLDACLSLFSKFDNVTIQSGYNLIKNYNSNWNVFDFSSKKVFEQYIIDNDIIVSHSGVGVISTVLKYNKMAFVIPRKHSLKEHTNNHQVEFVEEYNSSNIFYLFSNVEELKNLILKKKYLNKPMQKYITNLQPLKENILTYINKNI